MSGLTYKDIRRAAGLVNECRDLGADAPGWHRHLLEGLRVLARAQVVIGGHMRNFGPRRQPESLGILRLGWADADAERRWTQYAGQTPVQATPEWTHLSRFTGPIITRLRDQIWGRDSWYRSSTYHEVHKSAGIDDYIMSIAAVRELGLFNSIWLHRAVGAPEFTRREWHLVRFVHAEIGRMLGTSLATPAEPPIAALSRRRRQVLDCLLDGDSEKQAAYRLGLSTATVHEHVAALHQHFMVSSRGELLSKFVGRARPPRA